MRYSRFGFTLFILLFIAGCGNEKDASKTNPPQIPCLVQLEQRLNKKRDPELEIKVGREALIVCHASLADLELIFNGGRFQ